MLRELDETCESAGLQISLDSNKTCWSCTTGWRGKTDPQTWMDWGRGPMGFRGPHEGLPLLANTAEGREFRLRSGPVHGRQK